MTARKAFKASLLIDGKLVDEANAYAFNSTVRASEALLRTYARSIGQIFEGKRPSREGNTYTRQWLAGNIHATTMVQEA